jgi:pimeloyl-ACP methyl ester carboxylesterase
MPVTDFAAPPPFHRGGSGTPLLLLHGFTDTWLTWRPVIPELERNHDVFAPTLPGHFGAAAWERPDQLSLTHFVDAIEKQMDDAGIASAHIAGNSLGGWLALELAVRGRALSVVALCPGGGWIKGNRHERRILRYFKRSTRMSRLAAPRAERLAKHRWIRTYSMRDLVAHPERVTPEVFVDAVRGSAQCEIAPLAITLARTEGFSDLGPIACPVRIVWGGNDRIIRWPACYARFPSLLQHAEYVRLDGVGHLPHWDEPGTVTRTILEVTHAGGVAGELNEKAAGIAPGGF